MTEVFLNTVNRSIIASILVLLIFVLRLLFAKAPRWINVLLWGLAAVRLICPFGIESPFSLIPETNWISEENIRIEDDAEFSLLPDNIHDGGDSTSPGNDDADYNELTGQEVALHRCSHIFYALSCIWFTGISVMIIYLVFSYLQIFRHIRTGKPFRDNIYTSEMVMSPFVFGVIRPRICLPENMDAVNMSYVIAHEEAHIRRRDHLWKPFGFLLLTVHWFNPLLWVSYILFCRDIEMACDECVIKDYTDMQRADYSEALLECSIIRKRISACPLAFGEAGVKARIKSVLNYKKPAFRNTGPAVFACIVTAACFLTNPITDEEKRDMENNEYIEQTQTVSIQKQNTTSETLTNDLASVKEYADDIIASAAETMFGSACTSGIQNLEQISTGNSTISGDILLYRLEYWIKEGIRNPDRADPEDVILEEVYFAMLYDRAVESWIRLGILLR